MIEVTVKSGMRRSPAPLGAPARAAPPAPRVVALRDRALPSARVCEAPSLSVRWGADSNVVPSEVRAAIQLVQFDLEGLRSGFEQPDLAVEEAILLEAERSKVRREVEEQERLAQEQERLARLALQEEEARRRAEVEARARADMEERRMAEETDELARRAQRDDGLPRLPAVDAGVDAGDAGGATVAAPQAQSAAPPARPPPPPPQQQQPATVAAAAPAGVDAGADAGDDIPVFDFTSDTRSFAAPEASAVARTGGGGAEEAARRAEAGTPPPQRTAPAAPAGGHVEVHVTLEAVQMEAVRLELGQRGFRAADVALVLDLIGPDAKRAGAALREMECLREEGWDRAPDEWAQWVMRKHVITN
jgi:hypothetical protein